MTKDHRGNELEDQKLYLVTVGNNLRIGKFCQKGFEQSYFETKDSIIFVEEASKIEEISFE